MSSSSTSRLGLHKPDPGTGEPVDVAKLNQSMDKIDAAIAPAVVTSTTRPASPYPNQMIRETNTGRTYIWNATSSAWNQIVIPGVATTLADVVVERSAAGDIVIRGLVSGDSQSRVLISANGTMTWGSGSASPDTNLYRGGANMLKTDDNLEVAGYLDVDGGVSFGNAAMQPTESEDNTLNNGIASLTPIAGTPQVGHTFVAPPSGSVMVSVSGYIQCGAAATQVILSFEVRQGSTVGSGTVIYAADGNRGLRVGRAISNELTATRRNRVFGLTPGTTYNVRTMHWMGTGASGVVAFRNIMVEAVI